jgi:Ohr subfamily peroxiredoxin
MKLLYTAHATASGGGREGLSRTDDGRVTVTLALPPEMGGTGKGTNPEQLFATGYSACYLGALRHVAGKQKVTIPEATTVTSDVSIGPRDDGGGFGLAVTMTVHLPGLDKKAAEDLAASAHVVCPYSHSIKGNVAVTTNVTT